MYDRELTDFMTCGDHGRKRADRKRRPKLILDATVAAALSDDGRLSERALSSENRHEIHNYVSRSSGRLGPKSKIICSFQSFVLSPRSPLSSSSGM